MIRMQSGSSVVSSGVGKTVKSSGRNQSVSICKLAGIHSATISLVAATSRQRPFAGLRDLERADMTVRQFTKPLC